MADRLTPPQQWVLDMLRQRGPLSARDLSRLAGRNFMTMRPVFVVLLNRGLIVEVEPARPGSPAVYGLAETAQTSTSEPPASGD